MASKFNIAAKCTAKSAISQAEIIAPALKECLTSVGLNLTPAGPNLTTAGPNRTPARPNLTPSGPNRTPAGPNTSSGDTVHATLPSDLSSCLTHTNPLNAAANIKPVDFLEKVKEACLNKKLEEKDRSLCEHVMKRLQEKKHLGIQVGKLTIMFRSCDPVVITFGEGDEDLLALIENGIPSLTQTIPETVMFTCPPKDQYLESFHVRNATKGMFLCEEDNKLIRDIEELIIKKTGEPRQQIKDVTLTFFLKNGSTIQICHGNQTQKLHAINADGKLTLKWEYRNEPDDIMNKVSDAFRNVELSDSDKSLHINVIKRVAEEKNRLPFNRLRVVLESGKEIVIEIGEGDTEFLVFTENGKTKWNPPFVPDGITYTSQNALLESNDIKSATQHTYLDEEETRLVKFAEATVSEKNGIPGLRIRNVVLTISSENGRLIEIAHGDKSQKIKIITVKGEPLWIWEHRTGYGQYWENIYYKLSFCVSQIYGVIMCIPNIVTAVTTLVPVLLTQAAST